MSRAQVIELPAPQTLNPVSSVVDTGRYDHAWRVLLGASICFFCGQPAVAYYTFGVFLPEIISDTHWSAAGIAASIGPGALIASAISPFIGMLCDRLGVRTVALVGAPAFAIGFAVLGLLPTSATTFTFAMMVLWLLVFAGSPIPYAHILAGWFDRRRGMAISVMFASGALGIAVWPRYAAYLIANLGWRHAYVVLGGSAAAVILVAALLLLKNPLVSASIADGAARPPGRLVREARGTARFWKTAATFLLLTAVLGGMAVNFPVILRQQGVDAQTAASVMSVVGIAMFLGRLALGLTLDRWFSPYVTIAITAVSMLAFGLLMASSSKEALVASAGLLGFGLGSEYAVAAYVVSRAFGFRSYGAIYGLITLATSVGAALGPAAIGVALVSSVGIDVIAIGALSLLVVAIVVLLTFKREDLPFGAQTVPISKS